MKKQAILACLTAAVLMLGSLSGCSNRDSAPETPAETTAAVTEGDSSSVTESAVTDAQAVHLDAVKEMRANLEQSKIKLLDCVHTDAEGAKLAEGAQAGSSNPDFDCESAGDATILTFSMFSHDDNDYWDKFSLVKKDTNEPVEFFTWYRTAWAFENCDENGKLINYAYLFRLRIAGSYEPDELAFQLRYTEQMDETGNTLAVSLPFAEEGGFEEMQDIAYWQEAISPYYEDADEAAEVNPVHHTYLYQINGIWYYVYDEDITDSVASKKQSGAWTTAQDWGLTPLQGPLGHFITEDMVDVKQGGTHQDFLWEEIAKVKPSLVGSCIQVNFCIDKELDKDAYFEALSEAEKGGQPDADAYFRKLVRAESREAKILLPDGNDGQTEVGTIKIDTM